MRRRTACLLLTAWALQQASVAEHRLTLLPSAETTGPQVLLGELVGENAALPESWRERPVLTAPQPGLAERYAIETIAYALQKYPDMSDVVLRGKPSTRVVCKGRAMDGTQLAEVITQFVTSTAPWKGTPVQVECEPLRQPLTLPVGKLSFQVQGYEATGRAGQFRFHLALLVDGETTRTVPVEASVLPLEHVWVAARPLARGETLAPDLLTTQLLPMQSGEMGFIAADEDVAGLELERVLQLGQPLRRHLLRQPVCCRRGDHVSVLAVNGALQIQLQAKAMASGRRGDRILCMNERSKRRFLVELTGHKSGLVAME
ncbi:MAG: flagellar basal body P-ring formation protein FlgA [Kiritimatiellae bacterium]|nr:flagellar basal body P-ring formation protein FlgA [Kiritimatiellia bacterium]